MIAIATEKGALLKVLPVEDEKKIGYHRLFGFVSQETFEERIRNRERHGYPTGETQLQFGFILKNLGAHGFGLESPENCELQKSSDGWILIANKNTYRLRSLTKADQIPLPEKEKEDKRQFILVGLLSLLVPSLFLFLPLSQTPLTTPQIVEQVTVQIKKEIQKPVAVSSVLEKLPAAKRAIKQDLGFLGLLGRKDLTKAIGGAPTQLKDVSPGAGKGGKDGSGGEFLVGLGVGLKRTTVGNTGVAGLGGIGTRGSGGGEGGYGHTMIGSGEGKALSSIPLGQDMVLEGGLERSVVQATIAKYLNQVRACYEQGLKNNPGLGGLVTMVFEIGGGGSLNFARVQKTSLGDEAVEQCISTKMMGWKFPNPRGGVSVKITYPFLLRSARS